MKKDLTLTQNDFDALLDWLSANREEAGRQYEIIREGLIRFFRFRGCTDPDILADDTINRVSAKISTFDLSKNVKTITYFYGFASNVYFEYLRMAKERQDREIHGDLQYLPSPRDFMTADSSHLECECLEKCLTKLSDDEGSLVIQYYGQDKNEKFALRRKMAEGLNLKMPALHTRVHRLKGILKDCIEDCMRKNNL